MSAAPRRRADLVLVERGIFESRARARAAIEAGLVRADGAAVRRASDLVAAEAEFDARPPHPYVSRAGLKLAHALDRFAIDPAGLVCLDVGASTGGFTDVLLRRGAAHVHAVDVGRGQLHPSLARDPRVTSREATDIRRLGPGALPEPVALVTVDVSFISLRLVLPELVRHIREDAWLVALVKPQFEVGRAHVGRGGIVRDEAAALASLAAINGLLAELGFRIVGEDPSPIAGGDGNREYLIAARRASSVG